MWAHWRPPGQLEEWPRTARKAKDRPEESPLHLKSGIGERERQHLLRGLFSREDLTGNAKPSYHRWKGEAGQRCSASQSRQRQGWTRTQHPALPALHRLTYYSK